MADWKDILSDDAEQLSEEELLRYLDDEIPEEEKYSIEKKINSSPFEVDALQGLSQVQNKENLEKHVNQLNNKLRQLTAKRARKEKSKINIFQWMVLAILLLLFICIIGYAIIYLQNRSGLHAQIHLQTKKVLSLV